MSHLTDHIDAIPFTCQDCKHWLGKGKCRAFDEIPFDFAMDAESHNSVVPGQNGEFVFEAGKEQESIRIYSVED